MMIASSERYMFGAASNIQNHVGAAAQPDAQEAHESGVTEDARNARKSVTHGLIMAVTVTVVRCHES